MAHPRLRLLTKAMKLDYPLLERLSRQHGDSFYLLDSDRFRENYRSFLKAFRSIYPRTEIAYSYKTNYIPRLCKIVNELGGWAEVVSEMECELALRIGVPAAKIVYNGPYKSYQSVETVLLGGGTVNLDSARDVNTVLEIARRHPLAELAVGLRCNLDTGKSPSRFGLTVESELPEIISQLSAAGIDIRGLHCHYPDRHLESHRITTEKMLETATKLFQKDPPVFINLGGGYFGKMPPDLAKQFTCPVAGYDDYARVLAGLMLKAYPANSPGTQPQLFLEPGSALVADTMSFVTKVIDVKKIRSRRIATTAGSRYNINPTPNDKNLPLRVFRKKSHSAKGPLENVYDIAGYTCIESDYLYRGYTGSLDAGDFAVFENVGSYSIVMKPPFILPQRAIVGYARNGDFDLVKREETNDDFFETFL